MSQISPKKYKKIAKWLEDNGFKHVFGLYTPDTWHKNNYKLDNQYIKESKVDGYTSQFSVYITNAVSVKNNQNKYIQLRYDKRIFNNKGLFKNGILNSLEELEELYKAAYPSEYRDYVIDNLLL